MKQVHRSRYTFLGAMIFPIRKNGSGRKVVEDLSARLLYLYRDLCGFALVCLRRPGLVKGAWSVEEDENLVTLIGQCFGNWSELAAHTPGRTAKQVRL